MNTMTARSVAQVSFAFSQLRTFPSWISFASLVYLLQILLPGHPSCTHKSLMASTSILISCFLTVLTFHSYPLFQHHCRHMLSRVIIIVIITLSGSPGLLRTFPETYVRFFLPPAKVNTRDTPNFSLFGAHAFYMIKEI